MIEALISFFKERQSVKAAYLAEINYELSNQPTHFIFGFKVGGDMQPIISESAFIVKQFLKKDEIVDLVKIEGFSEIDHFFRNYCLPFYESL